MNSPSTEIVKWKIIVIESLPLSDRHTGKELYEDMLRYKNCYQSECVCEFYEVQTIRDFSNTISHIQEELNEGEILTLHIETHGSNEGVLLSSKEVLS